MAFDSSRLTAKEIAALLSDASASEIAALSERYAEDPRKQVQQALKSAQRRLEHSAVENSRVQAMYTLQRKLGGSGIIVGVDEVGRGPVAGPLTVGAVVLPDAPLIEGLNDSKKLSAARRETIAARIANVALAIGMAFIEPAEIDEIGMSAALKKAMKIAIEQTGVDPDCVLIDGNPVHVHPREKTIVKGDAKIASIAAASIVAKVSRFSAGYGRQTGHVQPRIGLRKTAGTGRQHLSNTPPKQDKDIAYQPRSYGNAAGIRRGKTDSHREYAGYPQIPEPIVRGSCSAIL